MVQRVPITVRVDTFEGPLDLLLYLIQSHELDISKISITKITDQYLNYIRLMQELNFDVASEFLLMAATLLLWKSKALLPQEETDPLGADGEEILTQEELVRRLLERQRFLAAGQELSLVPRLGENFFFRTAKKPPTEKVWKELDVTSLALSFQDILLRSRRRAKVLRKETVSLTDKILEFGAKLTLGQLTLLKQFLTENASRGETVVTFLASLELSRLKKMRLYQEEVYKPIYVELIENFDQEALKLATGFEYEKPADAAASESAGTPSGTDSSAISNSGMDADPSNGSDRNRPEGISL
ncbi:segregation/condensation protein A [bacterium]|jgi:segregation and condensation protein A|nr:segregation/condensation protein A [bacterium]